MEWELKTTAEVKQTMEVARRSACDELDSSFTMDELELAIAKTPNRAPGSDGVDARFIKHSPEAARRLLLDLFNFSWAHGVVPSSWREASVCPIPKPGNADRTDKDNYRPISLTSVTCKLFERMILRRLMEHVGHRLSSLQFGFRPRHSTVDALLRLQHRIFKAFEAKKFLTVGFLDIRKAFDKTWHDGLLHKLFRIGVQGNAWRWCRAFLADRRIRVVQDDLATGWHRISAGVPQGSVLSPFLFLVFINDIVDACQDRAEVLLYADDVALVPLENGTAGDRKLARVFLNLDIWSQRWRVQFNAKKSKLLAFNNCRRRPKIM
jgi:hypothetical protein